MLAPIMSVRRFVLMDHLVSVSTEKNVLRLGKVRNGKMFPLKILLLSFIMNGKRLPKLLKRILRCQLMVSGDAT